MGHPTTEVSETTTGKIIIKGQITVSGASNRILLNSRITMEDSETIPRIIPIIQTAVSGIIRLIAIPIAEDSGAIPDRQLSKPRLSRTPAGIQTAVVLDKTIINKKTDS